jgi:hypothetical protein
MTVNECDQSGMIKHGIESGSEVELRKFKSKECFEANIWFLLRFCVFVEVFDSFGTSKIECFHVILSTQSIFAEILRFLKYLKELKKLEKICKC